jgi:hypothetical protein
MSFLAAIAVDKRQNYILSADKLQEMVGASNLIAATVKKAETLCGDGQVRMVRPVSGEIWVRAENLSVLQDFLFRLRSQLVAADCLTVTFAVVKEKGKPADSFLDLEKELQRQKSNRIASDGTPSSPYFARCRIQPELPANRWQPADRDNRRKLVSNSAARRRKAAGEDPLGPALAAPYQQPEQMRDMASGQENSYVAFIKADVDGLGSMQLTADWNAAGGTLGKSVYDVVKEFSQTIEQNVKLAVDRAIDSRVRPCYQGRIDPVLRLVQAGDDLWLICRREFALPFAAECGTQFTALCRENPVIQAVIQGKEITLSFGVLFAKQGFPLDRQLDLAEELLAGAKARRKTAKSDRDGYIDYFWLDSTGYEGIAAARRHGGGYQLPGAVNPGELGTFRLYTRPWTLAQTGQMLKAAEALKILPARKLHQLSRLLRLGGEFTRVALHQWYAELRTTEQEAVSRALGDLPEPFGIKVMDIYSEDGELPSGPWHKAPHDGIMQTALHELFELTEILAVGVGE